MQNDMRDRLIGLLSTGFECGLSENGDCSNCPHEPFENECFAHWCKERADYLIANGVILPPCKVGDTVYYIEGAYYNSKRKTVSPIKVTEISWKCDRSGRDLGFALIANGTRYKFSSIGKTVFLTREEAEKKLKENKNESNT